MAATRCRPPEGGRDGARTRLHAPESRHSLYMSGDARGRPRAVSAPRCASRPDWREAHFGIGVILETCRQDPAAHRGVCRGGPARSGVRLEAQFSLANALRRSGRVEESLSHYLEVLRLNPAVSQAGFGYAMGLVRLGRYREARDRLERDVQSFPDQPGLAHALARLLAAAPDDQVRDGERAVRMVEALTKTQPRRPCSRNDGDGACRGGPLRGGRAMAVRGAGGGARRGPNGHGRAPRRKSPPLPGTDGPAACHGRAMIRCTTRDRASDVRARRITRDVRSVPGGFASGWCWR